MSKFLDGSLKNLQPYVPGEQPKDMQYIKLNTNESPFPPSQKVIEVLNEEESKKLRLYSDPETSVLVNAIAEFYGVNANQILTGNGSDEILAFIFRAFCGEKGMACPDVSYGFYPVFCNLFNIKYISVPLKADFTVDVEDYKYIADNVIIANPNAQTGIFLDLEQVEKLLKQNKDRIVVIDEAYVDFGGVSAIPLIDKYDNLVVVQTMSKSRQLAGARIGFAISNKQLIDDLKTVKYSFNPYNVNRLSILAGAAAFEDESYFDACRKKIVSSRERLTKALQEMGFVVLPSKANFLLARHGKIGGRELYLKLKENGVLVRHLSDERISDFVRITIGADDEIDILLNKIKVILGEKK